MTADRTPLPGLGFVLTLYRWWTRQRLLEELMAAGGIAVGVGLVLAVLVANASVTGSASSLISGLAGKADLELSARSPQGFDANLAYRVQRLDGVALAAPVLRENVALSGPKGREVAQLVAVTPAITALGGAAARAARADETRFAGGVAIPARLGEDLGVGSGQPILLASNGLAHETHVDMVLDRAHYGDISTSPVVIAALPVGQALSGRPNRVTQVLIEARPGAKARVARELAALSAGRLNVQDARAEAGLLDEAYAPTQRSTDLFAAISTMVGFLLALTAMFLTLPQRRRRIAEMRILGYDGGQLLTVIVVHALMLGALGSGLGLGLGYVLSHTVLHEVPGYLSFAFPIGHAESTSAGVIAIAFASGIAAAIASSTPLAWDLRTTDRLDAVLRERTSTGQRLPRRATAICATLAAALTLLVAVLSVAAPDSAPISGALLGLVVALLTPPAYTAMVRLLAPLSARVRGVISLAGVEIASEASRAIALAGIAALAVYGCVALGAARADLTRGLESTIAGFEDTASAWVTTGNDVFDTDPFRAAGPLRALAPLGVVRTVRPYQGALLDVGGRRLVIRAHANTLADPLQPQDLRAGGLAQTDARLRAGGWAAVSQGFAGEHHLRLGSQFALPAPSGPLRLKVAALITNLGWPPGCVVLAGVDFERGWQTAEPTALEVVFRSGVSPAAGVRAIRDAFGASSSLSVASSGAATAEADASAREGLSSLEQISTLLILSAALAIACALGVAIRQRRSRLATMKAWGYEPRQLMFSLLLECTILVGLGSAVGAIVGLYGHAVADRYLRVTTGFPAPFSLGLAQMLTTVVPLAALSLLSLAGPSLFAARANPAAAFAD